jgi:hypothetical protein
MSAFTLVELLVAMVVLTIVVLLCAQMLVVVATTWNSGRSQADNFSKARIAMDIITHDVESAVIRQDLPAFFSGPTSPALTFYTKQAGLLTSSTTGNRPISRVLYSVAIAADQSCVLRRSSNGFNFGDDLGYSPAVWAVPMGATPINSDIGPGVLVMNYQFIDTTGLDVLPANINNGWANSATKSGVQSLRAITLSMAVIDGQNLKTLISLGKVSQLQKNFDTTDDPGRVQSFASAWQTQVDSPAHPLNSGGVPTNVLRGLKTFERTVMLPSLTRN